MKKAVRKQSLVITEKLLDDLKAEDFFDGIVDPERRKIAEAHNFLKWTSWHEENRRGNFAIK